jgi:hypothetical protein
VHGSGGGFNPRRLRFEFGQQLCRCACHAACPVQYETNRQTVSREAWQTSCTCPGADVARQRLDNAGIKVRDFDQMLEEKRRHRRAGKDAVAATRARAAGRGPEEVREIYTAELRARNLKVPEDRVLDAVVEYIITGNRLPALRELGEILSRPRDRPDGRE